MAEHEEIETSPVYIEDYGSVRVARHRYEGNKVMDTRQMCESVTELCDQHSQLKRIKYFISS